MHFPGFVPYSEMPSWYAFAEALIHPALSEQWGLILNEACASGLPILSSKTVGACPELVHEGENGYLFDPESVIFIKEVLLKFHALSPSLRKKLGIRSGELVRSFSPEKFGEGFEAAALRASIKK